MILKKLSNGFILDKPAGVSTHTPDSGATLGFLEMASRILDQPLWAVHRLDRDTSGCLLVATSAASVAELTETLSQGRKKYVFISPVESKETVWSVEGRIEKTGSHQFGLVDGLPNSKTTFAKLGKSALGFLYEAEISTGKTHQIRIHATHSGLPILGDLEHGGKPFVRLMLHASGLELGEEKTLSPFPALFEAIETTNHDFYKFLASIDRRRFLITHEREVTDCFRLVHREWTGHRNPKLCAEKLGSVLQLLNYTDHEINKEFIENLALTAHCEHWFVRKMKDRGAGEGDSNVAHASSEMPLQWQVTENKIKFDLRHNHGQSSGLFLDQRENRKLVLHKSQGKRVANFFSYTCGFSVAAALGGAHEVVSIDTSGATLDWAKNNFVINGLDPAKFEFFVADSQFFLKSCIKRGRKFDLIILDPPTFSRHKHGVFKLKDNLPELLDLSFQSLTSNGELLITSNDENFSSADLGRMIEESAGRTIKRALRLDRAPLPYDFEFPLERNTVMKGFWVSF